MKTEAFELLQRASRSKLSCSISRSTHRNMVFPTRNANEGELDALYPVFNGLALGK